MKSAEGKTFLVRHALKADAQAIASLAHQLLTYENSLDRSMGELTSWASSPSEILKQMRQPNLRFFVAERGGEIVGYIKVMVIGVRLSRTEIGFWRWTIGVIDQTARDIFNLIFRRPRKNVEQFGGYIAGLYVDPGVRRSGAGAQLVETAESWLRKHGIPTCDLHVLFANEAARRFWEARGYLPLAVGLRKPLGNLNRAGRY